MTPAGPVTFTVWSDYLCPWCYVTAVRLEEVKRAAGDALAVEWRSFLLRPQPEARPLDRFRQYAQSWHRPAEAEPRADFRMWDGDAEPPSHSMPPAIAAKVAASFGGGAFDRFHIALMRAYFDENRTVSERAVLLAVAAEAGIDTIAFAARFDTQAQDLTGMVIADHKDALSRGIAAVPTVLVADEYVLTGAMSVEQYSKVVARLGS